MSNPPLMRVGKPWPWASLVVVVGMVAYAAWFSWFTIAKAHNFNAGWYDLGIMTQTVWRTGHGHGFVFTNPEIGPGGVHGWDSPRTAIHTDYILALLSPLSWTGHTMEALLIVQALVLALGAWFVFRIARTLLKSSWLGVLLGYVYLLYPPLHFANIFEFHAVTLAITFILGGADAIIHGKHRAWWIWAALACITKEQVGITVGLVGLVLYWWRGERRRAVWALVVPWAWVALQIFLIIPLSRPGLSSNFVSGKFYFAADGSPASPLQRMLNPREWIERLPTRTHLHSLYQLFAPLGLLPLLSIWPLLAIPEMLLYWLSDSPDQQHILHHYHALTIPLLFLGAIFAWRLLIRLSSFVKLPNARQCVNALVVLGLLMTTFVTTRSLSAWPWSPTTRWPVVAWKEKLAPQVDQALSRVPPEASVAFTQNLGPFMAERLVAQLLPNGVEQVEYIVILERSFDPNVQTNSKRLAEREMLKNLKAWVGSQPEAFTTVYRHERVYVFRRTGDPTLPVPSWPAGLLGQ